MKDFEQKTSSEAANFSGRSLYQWQSPQSTNQAMVYLLLRSDESVVTFLSQSERAFRRFSKVIFIVTCNELSEFRFRRLIVERLPDLEEMKEFGAARPWPEYLRRRHLILKSKWKPAWLLAYGLTFDEYLKEVERNLNGITRRAV